MDRIDNAAASPVIDFWFEFGSQYSYLSVMRIEPLAARAGVQFRWKPFLLGPIFKTLGWNTSPFVIQKAKGDYAWKDMTRQAGKYGVPWKQPTEFPRSAILPHRVALLAADQPWCGAFCREIMQMNFARDETIDNVDAVTRALVSLGLPAAEWIAMAQADDNKLRLRLQTEKAQALGIFGAPTFIVDSEMFWGNDRLEDAIHHARGG
ncbi:MAG: 2-hydroxychromene-2-carboxylate isomerase [Pseudomonadota bacterium]